MKDYLRMGNLITLGLILLLCFCIANKMGYIPIKKYTANDFGIEVIKSDIDYDSDGIDDYTDIVEGARAFTKLKPRYKSKYYEGGYPTDKFYVCTDLFWYALKNAGYDFKKMIDEDIKNHLSDYDIDIPDDNIDFRRVKNIKVFLDKYATKLSLDGEDYEEFQPGDIVIYKKSHIAIVSDKRNKHKISYILHHDGTHAYDDNGLMRHEIIGHYRFILSEYAPIYSVK